MEDTHTPLPTGTEPAVSGPPEDLQTTALPPEDSYSRTTAFEAFEEYIGIGEYGPITGTPVPASQQAVSERRRQDYSDLIEASRESVGQPTVFTRPPARPVKLSAVKEKKGELKPHQRMASLIVKGETNFYDRMARCADLIHAVGFMQSSCASSGLVTTHPC